MHSDRPRRRPPHERGGRPAHAGGRGEDVAVATAHADGPRPRRERGRRGRSRSGANGRRTRIQARRALHEVMSGDAPWIGERRVAPGCLRRGFWDRRRRGACRSEDRLEQPVEQAALRGTHHRRRADRPKADHQAYQRSGDETRRGRARAVPALLLSAHAPGARLPNPIVAAPVDLARSPRRRDRPGVSPEIQLVGRLRGGQCRQTTQERLHPPAENPPDCKALRRHPLWIRIANNAAHRPAPPLWTA